VAVALVLYPWLCAGTDWQQSVKSIRDVKEQQLRKTYADIVTSDMRPTATHLVGFLRQYYFLLADSECDSMEQKMIVGQHFPRHYETLNFVNRNLILS
jgi:hypothetical protein